MNTLYIIGGILLLYVGGELLVNGAVKLARSLGVRQLVIGLTVVAFGTSSPELAASLVAAFKGVHDVVLGNVVGSNILNIGLILGISAILRPLVTDTLFLRRELPFMIGTGALLILLIPNGIISRIEGLLLFSLLGVYLTVLYRERKGEDDWQSSDKEVSEEKSPPLPSIVKIIVGTALLTVGASGLVTGAIAIAESMGVSERIIGLTIVAFGTSLPELASCIVACVRRHTNLILGSLVGSSIFNVLAILGFTSLAKPIAINAPAVVTADLWMMTGFGTVVLLLMMRGRRLVRWEGGFLLGLYILYFIYLVM